jgi:hypothetical protein
MSVISLLVSDPVKLPTLKQVELEAAKHGDPLEFPFTEDDLKSFTGYLPVNAFGRPTGFEFYFEKIDDPDLMARFGSHALVTRTFSDYEEGRAACIFLKVAARLTSGAYVYPADDVVILPADVEQYLNDEIDSFTELIRDAS